MWFWPESYNVSSLWQDIMTGFKILLYITDQTGYQIFVLKEQRMEGVT